MQCNICREEMVYGPRLYPELSRFCERCELTRVVVRYNLAALEARTLEGELIDPVPVNPVVNLLLRLRQERPAIPLLVALKLALAECQTPVVYTFFKRLLS